MKSEKFGGLASGLVELVVGVLLLINPVGFTSGIVVGAGVLFAASGAVSAARYFLARPEIAAQQQGLSRGLLMMMLGVACVLCSNWFLAAFPVLTRLYGILLLVMSAAKIQLAVDMLRLKRENWLFAAISAAVSTAAAIVVLLNPFETTTVIWILMALSLIAEAVLDILTVFFKGMKNR